MRIYQGSAIANDQKLLSEMFVKEDDHRNSEDWKPVLALLGGAALIAAGILGAVALKSRSDRKMMQEGVEQAFTAGHTFAQSVRGFGKKKNIDNLQ